MEILRVETNLKNSNSPATNVTSSWPSSSSSATLHSQLTLLSNSLHRSREVSLRTTRPSARANKDERAKQKWLHMSVYGNHLSQHQSPKLGYAQALAAHTLENASSRDSSRKRISQAVAIAQLCGVKISQKLSRTINYNCQAVAIAKPHGIPNSRPPSRNQLKISKAFDYRRGKIHS